jgi:hypothetical protein
MKGWVIAADLLLDLCELRLDILLGGTLAVKAQDDLANARVPLVKEPQIGRDFRGTEEIAARKDLKFQPRHWTSLA